ncbi:MAG: class I SAM-dependent DNA methyltransferase, partial [Chitinophagaceae bacterium]
AALLMGKLHDKLKAIGYEGHALELYLVRLVFLLFADDTNIFEKGIFYDYLDLKTKEDGSDLAAHLSQLFEILNTPKDKRLSNLDEALAAFPYVNGKLFEERLPTAGFDSSMRKMIMDSCLLDWGKISPAIFGSLFQSVMDEKARRNLGAHYTSEKNILKLIKPLFLDELWEEYEKIKEDKRKLQKLHEKISKLRFLDPACGCGNFLIVAYRELRLLEMEIVKQQLKGQTVTDISNFFTIDVDGFYGIEYEEFPAQIAQLAMWLIDQQMNMKASETFGGYYVRLPLPKSATIVQGNALRIDWQGLIDPMPWEKGEAKYDYILGNPPFVGSKLMNDTQRKELKELFQNINGSGVLDYVSAWYIMAAQYMQKYSPCNAELISASANCTKVAFVSTNSISQGEQVGILWNELFNKYNCKIHFAHKPFNWSNEARGNAAVHVVIIGFANFDIAVKKVYEYEHLKGEPHEKKVKNINSYLVEGKDIVVLKKQNPLSEVPKISFGNMPLDGGNLLLTNDEKVDLLMKEPKAEKFIRPLISAREFLNNEKRWCLWLISASPTDLREMPLVLDRIAQVKKFRLNSIAPSTQKFASIPTLFRDRQTPNTYILIPSTTSVNRKYIPLGFFTKYEIANNSTHIIPLGTLYHFGILSSEMHMAWVRHTCGRLKSDFRYSKDIVYNNFPWPESPTEKQIKSVEEATQTVLDARAQFSNSSLADLYDPNTMPPQLVKAHQQLVLS